MGRTGKRRPSRAVSGPERTRRRRGRLMEQVESSLSLFHAETQNRTVSLEMLCVCCRYSCGRCCFEHFVSADEGSVELAVHREHTEDHQAALWDLH